LVEVICGELANGTESQTWGICVATNDFETGVVRVVVGTNGESDYGGVVAGEEVFSLLLEGPVICFCEFFEAT